MFILQNQDGYFLSKSGEWIDGRILNHLFRTPNKDEAVNQMFEINSQDYSLRINLLECEVNAKNLPLIPEELLPPPLLNEEEASNDELELTAETQAPPVNDEAESEAFTSIQSQSA